MGVAAASLLIREVLEQRCRPHIVIRLVVAARELRAYVAQLRAQIVHLAPELFEFLLENGKLFPLDRVDLLGDLPDSGLVLGHEAEGLCNQVRLLLRQSRV